MQTTTLSNIIDIMNQWKDIENIEERYKVQALDTAIRKMRQRMLFPWTLKKSTLRVFKDILEYPIASDHDELAYLDNMSREDVGDKIYARRARFFYTSLQQFYEDTASDRNTLAEIWDNGTKFIGVRYKDQDLDKQILSDAEDDADYVASDDASAITEETVNYKKGNQSIRFTVTSSAGTATITNTFTAISDSNYKRKYHFRWVYLDAVPTSIEMRLQTDGSNYLSSGAITTQFSGQAFQADAWNLIGYDLNTATETGTFNSANIASEKTILTGAATGTYYIDESSIRAWELFDYYYYGKYMVLTSGATAPTQEFFTTTYDLTMELLGDSEWVDVVINQALEALIASVENTKLFSYIMKQKQDCWDAFYAKYPDMVPVITTLKYRFNNEPQYENSED